MLRSHGRLFSILQKLLDLAISLLIWLGLFVARFYFLPNGRPGMEMEFVRAGLILSGLTIYFFSREGLYRSHRMGSRFEELIIVLKANCLINISFVVLLYFLSEDRLSRGVLIAYFIMSTVVFSLARISVRNFLRFLRRKGRNLRHIVVVGNSVALQEYIGRIKNNRDLGVDLIGWVDSQGLSDQFDIQDLTFEELKNIGRVVDMIAIGYQNEDSNKMNDVLKDMYNDVVPIIILPDLAYSYIGYELDHFAGIPAFAVNQPNLSSADIVLKRIFDICASGLGLLLLSPLLIAIAVIVKISSRGPIFYPQIRIGLDGRKFKMWKFRSMKMAPENPGDVPGWTVSNDPRRTKIGTFIRATSVDELPQLWNVFIGEMSIVGPRPEQPYYVNKFRHEIPAYMLRHKMKAGITGWAQVNGWRGDTSLHKRIECDLYYIKNWSLWLDFKIIFLTFWKGFINKNAY